MAEYQEDENFSSVSYSPIGHTAHNEINGKVRLLNEISNFLSFQVPISVNSCVKHHVPRDISLTQL